MISPTQTRDIIEERIFIPLGTMALFSSYIGTSVDSYGDDVSIIPYAVATSIILVPANYVNTDQQFFQFGDLEKGTQDFIVRPNVVVNIRDKITYGGSIYYIKALKDYVLSSTSIFTAIHCAELL